MGLDKSPNRPREEVVYMGKIYYFMVEGKLIAIQAKNDYYAYLKCIEQTGADPFDIDILGAGAESEE